ncbi:extracellular electron transfer flavoprotein PplA [Enterococcus lemanii]|uniref:Extracellular electron transfer flavoprotein PplA n=1 Tax=Enterococcus lemanii TaxID=1159752 RepID=A0ABV9MV71_9ENTE|nr:extracellular electron transfer flavoprotein PplA [Enterococcus lemanii]MBM7708463.1 major membrane immunogen (membrane-anchored lipoprotein) [Enterococcus lemanii]
MKAKKFLVGFAALTFTALVLGACSPDSKTEGSSSSAPAASSSEVVASSTEATPGVALQDGTYTLEETDYSNDYRVVFSIVVKDGKIAESKYDNLNEAGESKVENADYNKMMVEKAGIGPEEFIPAFNEALIAAQNPVNIEVISGATHSFRAFQNYAQQLIQAAQAGNTETIVIKNGGELKDGTYTLEETNYNNDYRVVFSIVVKDGQVVESNYDNVNEAGESKVDNAEYNEMMKEKAGIAPETFIPEFNKIFVEEMKAEDGAPTNLDVVSGATHSFDAFVIYAQQLLNAAQNGDTETITIDNPVQ